MLHGLQFLFAFCSFCPIEDALHVQFIINLALEGLRDFLLFMQLQAQPLHQLVLLSPQELRLLELCQ